MSENPADLAVGVCQLDTYEDAKQWFIDQSKKRIKNLECQIKYYEDKIDIERKKIEQFKMMEE